VNTSRLSMARRDRAGHGAAWQDKVSQGKEPGHGVKPVLGHQSR